jgi:inorganic pyrophosphatase
MEETLIPLNDSPVKIKKTPSFGSSCDLSASGESDTLEYRVQGVDSSGSKKVSLWHDISLTHISEETKEETPYYNFVCEIPKFTRKKFEIATDEEGNPIKQDEKKGKLREFKKGDIFFNYGCFPQTWEHPTFVHPDANGCRGDNDPLDVCEIGNRIVKCGAIRPVKVLGILCMIDEGEADWKVVVIDAEDKWAPFLNDVNDVEEQLPGTLDAIREWFRTYKIPDGKPPNVFGLDEKFMDKTYAKNIIDECYHAWDELVSGKKERAIGDADDDVAKLVRNLSKNSLFVLGAENIDEHANMHPAGFEEQDDVDVLMF